jgi:hypothetical protein
MRHARLPCTTARPPASPLPSASSDVNSPWWWLLIAELPGGSGSTGPSLTGRFRPQYVIRTGVTQVNLSQNGPRPRWKRLAHACSLHPPPSGSECERASVPVTEAPASVASARFVAACRAASTVPAAAAVPSGAGDVARLHRPNGCFIEAPWTVNGGHGASIRRPLGSPPASPLVVAASRGGVTQASPHCHHTTRRRNDRDRMGTSVTASVLII